MPSILTPLQLNELLGAPMCAIVEAEAQAARATAEFIKEVGFLGSGDATNPNYGEVRMVTFSYTRRNANGTESKATLEIPLLTLVPIPAIQVSEATINFDLVLTSASEEMQTRVANNFSDKGQLLKKQSLQLRGLYAKSEKQTPGNNVNSTKVNMSVQIKLQQADLTHGMVQLLNLLDKGVNEK